MPKDLRRKRLEKVALQRASQVVLFELSDPRLTFVTLTRVDLADDLSHGTIYWSTLGEGGQRTKVEHALRDAAPVVQAAVAKAFHTRRSPHLSFRFDKSIEGAIRVGSILKKLEDERKAGGEEE